MDEAVEGRGDCVLHPELDVLVVAVRPENARLVFAQVSAELGVELELSGELRE